MVSCGQLALDFKNQPKKANDVMLMMNAFNLLFYMNAATFEENKLSPEMKLRRNLTQYYDFSARPVMSPRTAINVTFEVMLYQLVGIDPKDQTITMLMFQCLSWTDEFLQWDPAEYDGIETLRYYRYWIWTPDILPYNDVGSFDLEKYDFSIPIKVNYNGTVAWMRPVEYETTCSLDVTRFPFDVQECDLVIGSWQYFEHEVSLNCAPIDFSYYIEDSLWSLESKIGVRFECQLYSESAFQDY